MSLLASLPSWSGFSPLGVAEPLINVPFCPDNAILAGLYGSFAPYPFPPLAGSHDDGDVICLTRRAVNKPNPLMKSKRIGLLEKGAVAKYGRFGDGWEVPKTDGCRENGPNHRSSTLTTTLVTADIADMRRMTPIAVENATHVLGKPQGWDEDAMGKCSGLSVIQSDGVFYSYWQASWRERMRVFFTGKVRLCVASAAHLPVMLDTES